MSSGAENVASSKVKSLWKSSWDILVAEGKTNEHDYRLLMAWGGFTLSVMWPLYGFLCEYVLHLRERMSVRVLIMLLYLWLSTLQATHRFGPWSRWVYLVTHTIGLGWLPWSLYFLNDRHSYWQQSVFFFAMAIGIAIRGHDRWFVVAATAIMVVIESSARFSITDLGELAIWSITLFLSGGVVDQLRAQRTRIELQRKEIADKNQLLVDAGKRKDEFTATIAHDLRTPLAVATSLAQELHEKESGPQIDALCKSLQQMHRQCDDLLDMERFQLGIARLEPELLDVAWFVSRFEEGFSSMARGRKINFQVLLGSPKILARFDGVRMEAVLFNLVSNALKYSRPGGLVEIHVKRENRDLLVSVVDDGVGIAAQDLPRIFERYVQVDRGPGTYTAGAGIGLALVKDIVDAHGGVIRVQSTPTTGSLFEVRLPNACVVSDAMEANQEDAPPVVLRPRGEPPLLVLVEDEELLRKVLEQILLSEFRVLPAANGVEALALIRKHHPDVVLSDCQMPKMDGITLLREMRKSEDLKGIPFALLTGSPGHQREISETENARLITKPFDRHNLVRDLLVLAGVQPD